jgi:hypothetical protein
MRDSCTVEEKGWDDHKCVLEGEYSGTMSRCHTKVLDGKEGVRQRNTDNESFSRVNWTSMHRQETCSVLYSDSNDKIYQTIANNTF